MWTNTLAGVILAGATTVDWQFGILLLAMTLAYTGGMFLNDAFDAQIDAKERPGRPIPSGKVSELSVFVIGYAMLAIALFLITIAAYSGNGGAYLAVLSGSALVIAIVCYNSWHKNNPLSPFVMGLCRMLVYVTAALTITTSPSSNVYWGALVLLCYLIGLTYTAKQENLGKVSNAWPLLLLAAPALYALAALPQQPQVLLPMLLFISWLGYAIRFIIRRGPGDIPRAVVSMIAGISLIDALFIGLLASVPLMLVAVVGFVLTLFFQRWVAGT